jgi:acetyl esterase/lipase
MNKLLVKFALAMLATLVWSIGSARTLSSPPQGRFCNSASGAKHNSLPLNMCFQFNVSYGSDPLQRFDVYMPPNAKNAPVILMVHGGGWYQGDKTDTPVVQNKVNYWVPTGVVFISVDYPLVPQDNPLQEAISVGQALAYAQRHAADWGADPNKFILMGFSAGGHLVSLLSAEPSLATSMGALPWLGTVSLDGAVYDVPATMNTFHPTIYDNAFGTDPAFWVAASPLQQLHARIAPFMAVCTSQEPALCSQAQEFVNKAKSYGTQTSLLTVNMSHGQIDANLGLPSSYTTQVNAFMSALYQGSLQAKPATTQPRRLIGH